MAERLWKSRLIPRNKDAVVPSVILSPRSFDFSDIGETNPYIAEVLLKLFAYETKVILDPFCGSGTICRVARELNKTCICIDLRTVSNPEIIVQGDATMLPLRSNSIDAVITSPPYFRSIKYVHMGMFESESFDEYIKGIELFSEECTRILKPSGIVLLRVGDVYVNGTLIPLHIYWIETFIRKGFTLRHILIYVYWDSIYVEDNVKKVHDYLLVFRRE